MAEYLNLEFSSRFKKIYKKLPRNFKSAFQKRLEIFTNNQFNHVLNNHQLKGKYSDLRSININGDCRALYSIQIIGQKKIITFELIGTHNQLYNK